MRWTITTVLLALASLGLSGCTVPAKGATGISVNDNGDLMVEIVWCAGYAPDLAILWTDDGGNEKLIAEFTPTGEQAGTSASFPIEKPGGSWKASPAEPTLEPATTYRIYGATNDNSSSTAGVTFSVADRDKLTPDRVLRLGPGDESRGDRIIDRQKFQEFALSYC